jgi:hypothetical protein
MWQEFRYFETAVTNQNGIHGEVQSRLCLENVCYLAPENVLPPRAAVWEEEGLGGCESRSVI